MSTGSRDWSYAPVVRHAFSSRPRPLLRKGDSHIDSRAQQPYKLSISVSAHRTIKTQSVIAQLVMGMLPYTFAFRCLQAWQAVLTEVRLGMFSLKGGFEPRGSSRVGPGSRGRSRPEAALSSIFMVLERKKW
jgi:hypothetical protein